MPFSSAMRRIHLSDLMDIEKLPAKKLGCEIERRQSSLIEMVGAAAALSDFCQRSAVILRAIARYFSATADVGSATTGGYPLSVCSQMLICKGSRPSNSTPYCSAKRSPPAVPKI